MLKINIIKHFIKNTNINFELQSTFMKSKIEKRIKVLTWLFIVGIILSGLTAFPIETELNLLRFLWQDGTFIANTFPALSSFLKHIDIAITETNKNYPQIFYGTDWLAFAHIIIGSAFIGVLRNPVRNIWVVEWAMIACIMVFPLAWICGPIREIPVYWRIIDCSFGVFGMIPLWYIRKLILQLEEQEKTVTNL